MANAAEATRQRNEAKTNEQLANKMFGFARDAVNEYFTSVSQETLLDEPGMEDLRKRLLEQASKFYAKFAEERRKTIRRSARVSGGAGPPRQDPAAIDLKSEGIGLYQQSLDLYKALNAERPGDRNIEASLAGTYSRWACSIGGQSKKHRCRVRPAGGQRWTSLACFEPDNETYQAVE